MIQLSLLDKWFQTVKPPTNETFEFISSNAANSIATNVHIVRRPFQRSMNVILAPNGGIKVTVGKGVPLKRIKKFLEEQKDWIEKNNTHFYKLRQRYPAKKYNEGEEFLLRGHVYKLVLHQSSEPTKRSKIEEHDNHLILHDANSMEERKKLVRKYYEQEARKTLSESISEWSEKMNLYPKKISFRSMKSRWGSCSSQGAICLNWRLITFPKSLWEYVIIHELAHLKHHNHSRGFWQLVSQHCPNYRLAKNYLLAHHYEVDFLAIKSELHAS